MSALDFTGENPFGEPLKRQWLTDLETSTDFWNKTPQLQLIAHRAEQEEVSPWGLLALVQQHQASHIDATHVLVRRDGSQGRTLASGTGLSGYVGLVADSSGGKNTIISAASDMIPPATDPLPDGTGQGLVKSIAETVTVSDASTKERYTVTQFNQHVTVVHADEIDTLNAEFSREGSKTAALMRSLWTGGTAGMLNGDKERRATLPANMYRIHGVWGVQPENAYSVMEGKQVRGGSPQRWLWAPCGEFRNPPPSRTAPPPGTTFPLPVWNTGTNVVGASGGQLPFQYRKGVEIPKPTWITRNSSPLLQQWYTAARTAQRGVNDHEPYDIPTPEEKAARHAAVMAGHNILTTIKVAVWMAWLHGRPEPTDLDFELSLIQMQVSKAEAAGVWHRISLDRHGERQALGEQRGEEMHHATVARDNAEFTETQEVAEAMWKRLALEGPKPVRALRDGLSTRRRKLARDARELLESGGRLKTDRYGQIWAFTPNGMPVAPKGSGTYEPPV